MKTTVHPPTARTSTLFHDGFRYRVRHYPSERADYAPVVLLGGAFQSMEALDRFARYFAARTETLVVEPPGTGLSDSLPADRDATFLAGAVERALDHHGLVRVNVIGVSFGTAIAHRLAELRPGSVENLVLIGTMSHVDRAIERGLEACVEALDAGAPDLFADRVCEVLLNREAAGDIEGARRTERILRATATRMDGLAIEHFRTNANRLRRHRRLATDDAPAVRALVFTGEHDRITTPERCAEVAARFAHASCWAVERADHLVPLQRPDVCTRLVDVFLRGITVKAAEGLRRCA